MNEEYLITSVVDRLLPFVHHILYALIKAANDSQLSLDEAAREMGVKRETLKKRCQRGTFPYTKVGSVYYISKIDVNLYINGGNEELMKYNRSFNPYKTKKDDKS